MSVSWLIAPSTRSGAAPAPRVAPLADPGELPPWDRYQLPWPGREITSGGVTLHVRETPFIGSPPRSVRSSLADARRALPTPPAAVPRDAPSLSASWGPAGAIPAVYVHGLAGSGTNWTDLAAQLAPHAPGLAVDLPGFGRSRPLASGEYSPEAHADALLCFLAGQGRPVHLLGNSMGGAIGLVVAARRPELIRSLTLLAPAMPDRRPDPRRVSDPQFLLAAVPGLRARVLRRLKEITPRERVEQMVQLCYGDPSAVAEHRIAEAVEEGGVRGAQPWANEALWETTRGMIGGWFAGPSLWSAAARVTAPTLVVWGGRDRLVAPRLATRTTAVLRRGRLLALPEVGHVPQIEDPVTVARAVLGMWRAVDAGQW